MNRPNSALVMSMCAIITCSTTMAFAQDGACCNPTTGFCSIQSPTNCAAFAGEFQGPGSTCTGPNGNQCPTGACCLSNGNCTFGTPAACSTQGGVFHLGVPCASANCPQPFGACCLSNGTCTFGTFAQCTSQNGTFHLDVPCEAANCPPPPTGACCLTGGGCLESQQTPCIGFGHTWMGPGTLCATPDICESCATVTPGDFNADQLIDGRDIPGFVAQFLAPAPGSPAFCRANFVSSNPQTLDQADLAVFVSVLLGTIVGCDSQTDCDLGFACVGGTCVPANPDLEIGYDNGECEVPAFDCPVGPYAKLLEGSNLQVCQGFQGFAHSCIDFRVRGFAPNAVVSITVSLRLLDEPCTSCTQCNPNCNFGPTCVQGFCSPTSEFTLSGVTLDDHGGGVGGHDDLFLMIFRPAAEVDDRPAVLSLQVTQQNNPSIYASLEVTVTLDVHGI